MSATRRTMLLSSLGIAWGAATLARGQTAAPAVGAAPAAGAAARAGAVPPAGAAAAGRGAAPAPVGVGASMGYTGSPDEAAGIPANYQEEKVGSYVLPDPFKMNDGALITTASAWNSKRRPEILSMFESNQFGKAPGRPKDMTFDVFDKGAPAFNGKALRKQIHVYFTKDKSGPVMNLTVYTPTSATKPVPLFLGLGGSVAADPGVAPPLRYDPATGTRIAGGGRGAVPGMVFFQPPAPAAAAGAAAGAAAAAAGRAGAVGAAGAAGAAGVPAAAAAGAGRAGALGAAPLGAGRGGAPAGPSTIEQLLNAGFGYAAFANTDIDPDALGQQKIGIRGLYLKPGHDFPEPDEWGSIAAWAWGISRAIDYLETDKNVDAKRIAIHGVSRLGKTVMWAGAHDTRVAATIASCSGEGGAALSRRNFGETVAHLVAPSRYPYQFAANYARYASDPRSAPFDANLLVALHAPRPLLLQTGTTDGWSDPHGEFLSAVDASRVYTLLGKQGLGTDVWPKASTPILHDLSYYMHEGPHGTVPTDWNIYIDFLKMHLHPET